jgi:hypothetical protein
MMYKALERRDVRRRVVGAGNSGIGEWRESTMVG